MISPAATLARLVIRIYKLAVAPLLPPACRFEPTCSDYASQAIGRFGMVRGGWLAVRRLARCHPWGGFGYDPVPDSSVPGPGDRHTCSSHSWPSPGVRGGAAIRARPVAAPKVRL